MDTDLFLSMLNVDSTSSREGGFADMLERLLPTPGCSVRSFPVDDSTRNLLFSWGEPETVFCTHLDTVPPYIPPVAENVREGDRLPDGKLCAKDDVLFRGRGTCDAKGQIFAMYSACLELEKAGRSGFALLLLAGEETGSFGARAFDATGFGSRNLVVGEPTGNRAVKACKGTASFLVKISGTPCHSGYPQYGKSAVDTFVDLVNTLRGTSFPDDPVLGGTSFNIGKLRSDNPQNILSPELEFRIYFRTTPASHAFVASLMESFRSPEVSVTAFGGDTPIAFTVPRDFPQTIAAFGSDAPHLNHFARRTLYGPGSILTAHTPFEYVLLSELEEAAEGYVRMFEQFEALDENELNKDIQ